MFDSSAIVAGDITNLQAKTTNPQDPKLMKLVERKHRQEVKMLRTLHDNMSDACGHQALPVAALELLVHASAALACLLSCWCRLGGMLRACLIF